ncbi:MAG: hypothetical protein ACJA13_000690 [Paraglaciecola sp.]|jgi:hypothetical protein
MHDPNKPLTISKHKKMVLIVLLVLACCATVAATQISLDTPASLPSDI